MDTTFPKKHFWTVEQSISTNSSESDRFVGSAIHLNMLVVNKSSDSTANKRYLIRRMYFAALSALLLAVCMGLATGYSAPATYDMEFRSSSSVTPTKDQVTWIGSILALGAMIGGIFAGLLADKIGRKNTLIFNTIPFVLGWLTICYAKTVLVIIVGRFFCGLSCGIISVTVPMYCIEISTAEVRGILGSSYQGFLVIGNLLSVIIGSYITWEKLALNGAIFTTIAMIGFIFVPESPRWLLAKGKLREATNVMHNLQQGFIDAEKECDIIYRDLENQSKGKLSLEELKNPAVYKPALISVALMFFQQASGTNAVIFYSSSIFEISKDFLNPKKSTAILGAVQVVATLLSNFIIDKVGRKLLLAISGILMTLSLIILGIYYFMASKDADFQIHYSWIPLFSLILYVNAFSAGFGAIPWLLAAEMVPIRARSTVGGLATFANGLFAFTITKSFSDMENLFGKYGTFWFYSSVCLFATIFVILLVPETRGKQLEEIEKLFQNKKKIERNIGIYVIA